MIPLPQRCNPGILFSNFHISFFSFPLPTPWIKVIFSFRAKASSGVFSKYFSGPWKLFPVWLTGYNYYAAYRYEDQ